MLKTELGNIIFTINNQIIDYKPTKLANKEKNFIVDERYKVVVDDIDVLVSKSNTVIACKIDDSKEISLNGFPETGECLALISFMYKNIKLSIGVEGDIPGVHYEYMEDGLLIKLTKYASINRLTFFIAWLTMYEKEKEEIYTWFAADPTLSN